MQKYTQFNYFSLYFTLISTILTPNMTSCERNQLFLDDLCHQNSHPRIHLSLYKSRGVPAVTLLLSSDGVASFNCCLTVSSENNIALEINDVNLATDFKSGSCIDQLLISTATDNMAVCRQPDIDITSPDEASNSVEAAHHLKICYISTSQSHISQDVTPSQSPSYGFTLRLLAFASETDPDRCSTTFSGFQCRNSNRCLPTSLNCDGEENCFDGSDESDAICEQVLDSTSPSVGISVQGAVTLGGICVILFVVIAICVWQCAIKLRHSELPPTNSRQRNEIHNLPMTVYTIPIANLATSNSTTSVAVASSTSTRTDTIVVSCSTPAIEDSPPTYDSLFGNKTVTSTQTL